jgi:hypothetical protein
MRAIIKKLSRQEGLTQEEYHKLMEYITQLEARSVSSYQLFRHRYGPVLYEQYSTYLPEFEYTIGDVVSLLAREPELLILARQRPLQWQYFPPPYQPFLRACSEREAEGRLFYQIIDEMAGAAEKLPELPHPRDGQVVMLFEDNNPYKEPGLKAHFDRLSCFSFVTRLQSIRYLTIHKAKQDRVEVVAEDRLGGIFTNKQKSIYYYIYLTESSPVKARESCSLINLALYGLPGGQ